MHYKNGREAQEGDPVIGETFKGSGVFIAGTIHSLSPGSASTCNCTVAVVVPGGVNQMTCRNVGDYYHAADAFKAIDAAVADAAAKAVETAPPVSAPAVSQPADSKPASN